MDNSLNSHKVFLSGLKESLRTRGVRVKRKDLRQFFSFIHETCPWFPLEGTVDHKQWKRVGDALQDFYRTFGPEKVPVSSFSYWNLIHDILEVHSQDPDIKDIIKTGEIALKDNSRPPSACPSVAVDIPEDPTVPTKESPKLQPNINSSDTHDKPDPPKIPNIYPSLTSLRHQTDHSNLRNEEPIEEQAVHYYEHEDPWRLMAPTLHGATNRSFRPPPYKPISPQCVPIFQIPDLEPSHNFPLSSDPIRQAKISLTKEVSSLKEILQQKREHVQLIKEIKALDTELTSLNPVQTPSLPKNPINKVKPKNPILAFPVTRGRPLAHGRRPENPPEVREERTSMPLTPKTQIFQTKNRIPRESPQTMKGLVII
nr:uncharacterized protein LOC118972601 [Manis javanica]